MTLLRILKIVWLFILFAAGLALLVGCKNQKETQKVVVATDVTTPAVEADTALEPAALDTMDTGDTIKLEKGNLKVELTRDSSGKYNLKGKCDTVKIPVRIEIPVEVPAKCNHGTETKKEKRKRLKEEDRPSWIVRQAEQLNRAFGTLKWPLKIAVVALSILIIASAVKVIWRRK